MLVDLVSRKGIDLLYIMHSRVGFDALPAMKSRRCVKAVAQFHLVEPDGGWIAYGLSRYQNLIDRHIVITQHLKQHLIDHYYVEPHQVQVIHLGIDWPLVTPSARRFQPPLEVLVPARLDRQKAPMRVVQIAAVLKQHKWPVKIHMVGTGWLSGDVHAAIVRQHLQEYVTLEGAVPAQKMGEWYQKADVVMLTSDYEGLPLVILEAMAHQKPVITSNVGAVSEVVTPETGILVDPPDAIDQYVSAIEWCLEHPDQAQAMGQAGHTRIRQEFDWTASIQQYEATFYDVLGARPHS
jgi:glycosyltransferase involved in cell wall biosynthesis